MAVTPPKNAASAPVEAVQDGITRLEDVYETLNGFAYGMVEPPEWHALLTHFRDALDQMKQGASEFGL